MQSLKEILKVGDVVVIGLLMGLTLASIFMTDVLFEPGESVSVVVDGKEMYHLSLSENQTIEVQGPLGLSVIKVEKGHAFIQKAPCPYQTCVKMGKISRSGDIIVCIPNRILVKIEGKDRRELDSITM
jgi:hypothetical protein